nr:hypothetical protein CFP56_25807 [Quercus suber]
MRDGPDGGVLEWFQGMADDRDWSLRGLMIVMGKIQTGEERIRKYREGSAHPGSASETRYRVAGWQDGWVAFSCAVMGRPSVEELFRPATSVRPSSQRDRPTCPLVVWNACSNDDTNQDSNTTIRYGYKPNQRRRDALQTVIDPRTPQHTADVTIIPFLLFSLASPMWTMARTKRLRSGDDTMCYLVNTKRSLDQ